MAAYFELVPCVPVRPQAGALGQLQAEEWVDKPPGLWLTLMLLL